MSRLGHRINKEWRMLVSFGIRSEIAQEGRGLLSLSYVFLVEHDKFEIKKT